MSVDLAEYSKREVQVELLIDQGFRMQVAKRCEKRQIRLPKKPGKEELQR